MIIFLTSVTLSFVVPNNVSASETYQIEPQSADRIYIDIHHRYDDAPWVFESIVFDGAVYRGYLWRAGPSTGGSLYKGYLYREPLLYPIP